MFLAGLIGLVFGWFIMFFYACVAIIRGVFMIISGIVSLFTRKL